MEGRQQIGGKLDQAAQNFQEVHLRDTDLAWLVQRAGAGDQSALMALYDVTSRFLFGVVSQILGETVSAEEVLLDVYTQAWRQAGTFDPGRSTPTSWLVMLARTRAFARLRSGRYESQRDRSGEKTALESESGSADLGDIQLAVRSGIQSLSDEQRSTIELAYRTGLSHNEIALRLRQPARAIKMRTRLGMLKLGELLGNIGAGKSGGAAS
jgi:RNA polymerase sigma-70 factor, ECF subfamily